MRHRWMNVSVPRAMILCAVLISVTTAAPAGAAGGDRCTEPPAGLTAWWPGEGSAIDIVGDWHGTIKGDPGYANGKIGEAFTFFGTGVPLPGGDPEHYVEVDDLAAGDFGSDPFTVAFWMRSTTTGNGVYLIGKSHPDCCEDHGWDIRLHLGQIMVVGVNGWAVNITSAAVIEADTWYHIAVASDGATVTLYIDGEAAGSCPRQTITTAPRPMRFGFNTNYQGDALDGQLDEIQLFDRSLSPAEVAALAAAVPGGTCRPCAALPEGAIAWWRAEDNYDDAIGRLNGTPAGGVSFDGGLVGRTFGFGGSADYVVLPRDESWDFGTGSISVSAWFQTGSTGHRNILRYDTGAGVRSYWGLRLDPDGKLEFLACSTDGSTTAFIESDGSWTDGAWHHVTAVRDADAGKVRLYVDGAEAATEASDLGVDVVGPASAVPAIGAGALESGGGFEFFAGSIDEVAVFDRALTAEEAAAIYVAGGRGICHDCVNQPDGLVSWWRGDGNAFDAVGGNDGAQQNGATYGAGLVGQAFSFEAADAHVEVPHDASLSFGLTEPMSIELWAYRTGGSEDAQHLLGKRSGCSGSAFNYQIVLDSLYNTGLCFATSTGSVHSVCGDGEMDDIPLNTWTHVAATFDGTTKRLFINGREVGHGVATLGTPDEADLTIGTSGTCGQFGQEFRGLIDEAGIYDRALTRDEVLAAYRAGAFGRCTECAPVPDGLEAWWRAEGDATDAAGANDGTEMNGAGYGQGRVGRAFDLDDDAEPDYIEVPHSASLDITGAFSVEGWVQPDELTVATVVVKSDYYGTTSLTSFGLEIGGASADGKIASVLYGDAVSYRQVSDDAVAAGAWHHLAVTWDGSTTMPDNHRLYIDGELAQSWSKTNGLNSTMESLTIGAMKPPGYYRRTDGRIDELSIYSSELTAEEIRAIVAAGSAGKCLPGDVEPDAFTFFDSYGHTPGAIVGTDPITVGGIDLPAAIAITGCTAELCWYAVNDGGWMTGAGEVEDGDMVYVRQLTAATEATTTDLTLTVGGVSDTFSATTVGTFSLTVALAGTGSGTVTSSPAGIDCGATCAAEYDAGSTVELTATPDEGSAFSGWSGDADCDDGEVSMMSNQECTATFVPVEIFSDGFESGDTLVWTLTVVHVPL